MTYKTFLVITSIAPDNHPVLLGYSQACKNNKVKFILIGDSKSPENFHMEDCDFYSLEGQKKIDAELSRLIPVRHYSRKNLGYKKAFLEGAEVIIETDDDNIPCGNFWNKRLAKRSAGTIDKKGWVNIYRYFHETNIWPRGLPLDAIQDKLKIPKPSEEAFFPIQQGLADGNPDVDAAYRLMVPHNEIIFKGVDLALGPNAWCPFNSQNTTWFREAFPLLYLPSYCSFRMTDIWRSFVAQRIAWTCGWKILFHGSNVYQERNEHNLMKDFEDEIPGYLNNRQIAEKLEKLELKSGISNISQNMKKCYEEMIKMEVVGMEEMEILEIWLKNETFQMR